MIAVIDYGMGNLKSLCNALDYLGFESKLVSTGEELEDCDHVICPGVGSFPAAVENLKSRTLFEPLRRSAAAGKPFLGICLGMQLLAEKGFEYGEAPGLGVVGGAVCRLEPGSGEKVPHVGWNQVDLKQDHPVWKGIKKDTDFYFVHSYHFVAENSEEVLATSEYGGSFTSAVAKRNVVGVQFHPEKSQENGLRLLENFAQWDGTC